MSGCEIKQFKGGSLNGLGSGGRVPCPPSTCTRSRGGSHHPSPGRAGGRAGRQAGRQADWQGTGSEVLLPWPARPSSAFDPPTSDQVGPVHPAPRQPAPELQTCKPPLSDARSPSPVPGPPGLPELGWAPPLGCWAPSHQSHPRRYRHTPGFHEDWIMPPTCPTFSFS